MKLATVDEERRAGYRWMAISIPVLAAMLALWWLVEETNEQGSHDAELLPFLTLIPIAIGLYHLARSRTHA